MSLTCTDCAKATMNRSIREILHDTRIILAVFQYQHIEGQNNLFREDRDFDRLDRTVPVHEFPSSIHNHNNTNFKKSVPKFNISFQLAKGNVESYAFS